MKFIRLALSLGILSVAFPAAVLAQASSTSYNERPIFLLLHLDQVGTEHDVFFTIESSRGDDEIKSLGAYPVPQDYRETKLEDELRRLAEIVPNLSFQFDERNPKIIHAIDLRLAGTPGYAMEHRFDEFNFQGGADDLLNEIKRRGIPMGSATDPERGDPFSREPFPRAGFMIDEHTSRSVRSILSHIWGLANYSRVLWTARTERREGAVTAIHFRGAREFEWRSVPLEWHLFWLAREYDVFFTIEQSWTTGEVNNAYTSHQIPRELTRASLLDELQRISSLLPGFQYEIDDKNPRIIHIWDARLREFRSYGLDRTVRNFAMTGKLPDLMAEIARRGIPVAFQTSDVCVSVCWGNDFITVVHVKADQLKVRSLLTDFLPLSNYSRILWRAETERREGAITEVKFGQQILKAQPSSSEKTVGSRP